VNADSVHVQAIVVLGISPSDVGHDDRFDGVIVAR